MTLSKQLLILILTLFLMIFTINFMISVNNMRHYLQVESHIHAQDTATSLGLSLSPYIAKPHDPIIKTMISAIFDRGYYKEILLEDSDEKPLVQLSNNQPFKEAPSWFINWLPIETARAQSEINAGWNVGGVIYVTINPGYAYVKLYEQAKSVLWHSAWMFLLTLTLLFIILRFVLKPLRKINYLAIAISQGQFETIEKLPWTTEVRNVAKSMNTMSIKIAKMIKNLNGKLEVLGNKLQTDELTGLYKKSGFEKDIGQLFEEQTDAYIFLIKLDSLSQLVKEKAVDAIDAFLRDAAATIKEAAEGFPYGLAQAYHFFGAEFAIILHESDYQKVNRCARVLSHALADLGQRYGVTDVAHFGVVPFNALDTTAGMLSAANEAFEQARLINANGYYIRVSEDQAKDVAEWKNLVFNAIENKVYDVVLRDAIESCINGKIIMKEAFVQVIDNQGEGIAVAPFIAMAEKFEQIIELDKGVTEQVIDYITNKKIAYEVAINVSIRTIKSNQFRSWLEGQLENNVQIAQKLVFTMSGYAVSKEFPVYKDFVEFVHSLGAKAMLKRYDHAMSINMAKTLRPDYLRLSRDLSNGLSHDPGKVAFLETMKAVSELLDVQVLAENVVTDLDFNLIEAIGIAGASR